MPGKSDFLFGGMKVTGDCHGPHDDFFSVIIYEISHLRRKKSEVYVII
jgi:hypothetical protein